MIPPLIVQESLERGIDIIAITDHNASANVEAVQKAAVGTPLAVLPGIEVQTREEVHVLCIFDSLHQLCAFQSWIDEHMPPFENDIEHFGEQFVVDETGEFICREKRLLLTSADVSIEDVFRCAAQNGGLSIPAHVDRKAFGLIANLGMVPLDLSIDALEISRHLRPGEVDRKFPQLVGYPLLQSGDVHRLDEFLGANEFCLEDVTIKELHLAFKNLDNRSVTIREGC